MAWGVACGLAHGHAKRRAKKKGRAGMAVQPKSREETPKVGTPWRAGPGHGADLDMGVFVLRCNLAPGLPHDLREECGRLATGVCQMATLELWWNLGAQRFPRPDENDRARPAFNVELARLCP